MKKKISIIVIITIGIILCAISKVYGYQQVPLGEYSLVYNEDLKTNQNKVAEISEEYVSYSNNMFATVKVTVTKKKDKDGNISYTIGNDKNTMDWTAMPDYLFDNLNKDNDSWEVWLDVQYIILDTIGGDAKYSAVVQNIYFDDEGDFNPEEDGWKGQKKIDKGIKKVTKTAGSIFKLVTKKIPGFIGAAMDLGSNLKKNFVGTIISFLMDILRFVADVVQILVDSFQTYDINTMSDMTITYDSDYLYTDGAGKIEDEGSGKRDMYTKVGEYQKNDKEENDGKKYVYIDGTKEGFTKETPIPVIPGDLYYIALGRIEMLDTNFLVIDSNKHSNQNSRWVKLRNLGTIIIRVTIYISASVLIITLIFKGIRTVKFSFTTPVEREKEVEAIRRFTLSVVMLIGTVVIMGISIYGGNAIFKVLKMSNSDEGPIRVNVESAEYSFSTTVTGYYRYMSEIEDVDRYLEKTSYTLIYIVLVAVNSVTMIFMFLRVLAMIGLGVVGPIVTVLEAFGVQGQFDYRSWCKLYIKLSLIQIIIALIYKIILIC